MDIIANRFFILICLISSFYLNGMIKDENLTDVLRAKQNKQIHSYMLRKRTQTSSPQKEKPKKKKARTVSLHSVLKKEDIQGLGLEVINTYIKGEPYLSLTEKLILPNILAQLSKMGNEQNVKIDTLTEKIIDNFNNKCKSAHIKKINEVTLASEIRALALDYLLKKQQETLEQEIKQKKRNSCCRVISYGCTFASGIMLGIVLNALAYMG